MFFRSSFVINLLREANFEHQFGDYQPHKRTCFERISWRFSCNLCNMKCQCSCFWFALFYWSTFASSTWTLGKSKGLQEVPSNSLISEELYMLGNDHVSTAATWALANSWPVYQIKLGNRSAIMPNSFDVLGNGLSAGKRRLSIAHGCTRSM
jgi:hypothetical protein